MKNHQNRGLKYQNGPMTWMIWAYSHFSKLLYIYISTHIYSIYIYKAVMDPNSDSLFRWCLPHDDKWCHVYNKYEHTDAN